MVPRGVEAAPLHVETAPIHSKDEQDKATKEEVVEQEEEKGRRNGKGEGGG